MIEEMFFIDVLGDMSMDSLIPSIFEYLAG
jgi:hypothetical protein